MSSPVAYGFGAKHWNEYYGVEVKNPPRPLPKNIGDILSSQCPFWPDKKVIETHDLCYIPTRIHDSRYPHFDELKFSVLKLGGLMETPTKGYKAKQVMSTDLSFKLENILMGTDYWTLMTKRPIPGSFGKSIGEQSALVSKANKVALFSISGQPGSHSEAARYTLPSIAQAATCIATHYVVTGERLFGPTEFTRCEGTTLPEDTYVSVGHFDGAGLVFARTPQQGQAPIGAAASRLFL